jgi:hypothetical protein
MTSAARHADKKSGSARRGPADPLALVEFISVRLGARGLGGKKTELTANRFHGGTVVI